MKLSRGDFLDFTAPSGTTTGSTSISSAVNYAAYIKNYVETGSTANNLKPYGISILAYETTARTYTLDAPSLGITKQICLKGDAAMAGTAVVTVVDVGGEYLRDDSTLYNPKRYLSLQPPFSAVSLVGLSTVLWGVTAKSGTVQFTTAATYTT